MLPALYPLYLINVQGVRRFCVGFPQPTLFPRLRNREALAPRARQSPEDAGFIPDASLSSIVYAETPAFRETLLY